MSSPHKPVQDMPFETCKSFKAGTRHAMGHMYVFQSRCIACHPCFLGSRYMSHGRLVLLEEPVRTCQPLETHTFSKGTRHAIGDRYVFGTMSRSGSVLVEGSRWMGEHRLMGDLKLSPGVPREHQDLYFGPHAEDIVHATDLPNPGSTPS